MNQSMLIVNANANINSNANANSGVANEGWKVWDYCAGSLLVEEAGGVMSSLRGNEPFDLYGQVVIE